jgi:hypothetical protein
MIVVKLKGGLGNQMFQYAAGRSLAHMHQTELYFDTTFLDKDPNGAYTKRNLEISVFNTDVNKALPEQIKKFSIGASNRYTRTLQRHLPNLFTTLYAAESGNLFQKQFFGYPKNTYLDGFWQSEKYFKSIESILIEEFKPSESLNDQNETWLKKIKSVNAVSVHVRRGDYVSLKNAKEHHGILPIQYYELAIKYLQEKNREMELFVFSDDLDWCKHNLKFDAPIHFVDVNQQQNFHLDLCLMSHCKSNVVANSSFSWWAAWLNQNGDKTIVAPKQWYAQNALSTTDLIPGTWIQL